MARPLHPPTEVYPYYSSYKGRAIREAVYAKTDGTCWYCGTPFAGSYDGYCLMEIDHVIARSQGGSDDLDNLVPSCQECNLIKGNRGIEYLRFRRYVQHVTAIYEAGGDFSGVFRFAYERGDE